MPATHPTLSVKTNSDRVGPFLFSRKGLGKRPGRLKRGAVPVPCATKFATGVPWFVIMMRVPAFAFFVRLLRFAFARRRLMISSAGSRAALGMCVTEPSRSECDRSSRRALPSGAIRPDDGQRNDRREISLGELNCVERVVRQHGMRVGETSPDIVGFKIGVVGEDGR